jgi:predicted nucleotidyltransferase
MFNTLGYIGEKLNSSNIIWGVGASIMLNHYGLVDKPNDIDIIVCLKDIEKADEILKSIGNKKVREETTTYSTRHFYEYTVNGIDVDVMSGLRINHFEGIFDYFFDEDSITETKDINGIHIPLISLEDWYVIYQLIPGRAAKADMIEAFLLSNGIRNTDLLIRTLKGSLPLVVRYRVEKLLSRF